MGVLTEFFCGVDLGTGGVRVVILDETGHLISGHSRAVASITDLRTGAVEQDPEAWWNVAVGCLRESLAHCDRNSLRSIAVSGTSGTIVPLDRRGNALRPALLYSDTRAAMAADRLNEASVGWTGRRTLRFHASSGLSKVLWLLETEPDVVERTSVFAHSADVITGRLTGEWRITDWSHALKTGYDPAARSWPAFLTGAGIPLGKLPRVVAPGTMLGRVTAEAAAATGLQFGLPVIAGMTDGCASQIAAGAVHLGEWSTTLGTTLVLKGVTSVPLDDPDGRIYNHRLPNGNWMPGAASNTGGTCLRPFPPDRLEYFDAQALALTPTGCAAYPLTTRGERFPFMAAQAEGFGTPRGEPPDRQFAILLEGVAFVERLGYAVLEELGAPVGPTIWSAGGGSRSRAWLQIRADVLGREVRRSAQNAAAAGAAILAAAGVAGRDVAEVVRSMVSTECCFEPRPDVRARYDDSYSHFLEECRRRGYIRAGT